MRQARVAALRLRHLRRHRRLEVGWSLTVEENLLVEEQRHSIGIEQDPTLASGMGRLLNMLETKPAG